MAFQRPIHKAIRGKTKGHTNGSVPWYALGAGIFGLIVIGAISYMIPRIGVAGAITTIVAGQLMVSVVLDHFGWLGAMSRPLDPTRIIGLAVVLVGVWLTVK
jgi:transporter family-2 protein